MLDEKVGHISSEKRATIKTAGEELLDHLLSSLVRNFDKRPRNCTTQSKVEARAISREPPSQIAKQLGREFQSVGKIKLLAEASILHPSLKCFWQPSKRDIVLDVIWREI